MIVPLILELRQRGIAVGTQELVTLGAALSKGLHKSSLEQFYYVARSILIHDEANLDEFDLVFSRLFKDLPYPPQAIVDDLFRWLDTPVDPPNQPVEGPGNKPGPGQIEDQNSFAKITDARNFRSYRKDLTLDVRQFEVALKRLRHFNSEGQPKELDLERTIDATARNFGELELVFKRPRRPDTRVILMMDVGGSMDPFSHLLSQLFTAAKRARHWKELRTYYFHNCPYGCVFSTEGMREQVLIRDLLRQCDPRYKLIIVGDASMAPSEFHGRSMLSSQAEGRSGADWLTVLRQHFDHSIWLNPWANFAGSLGSTIELIGKIYPMFPITLAGLDEGLKKLNARR